MVQKMFPGQSVVLLMPIIGLLSNYYLAYHHHHDNHDDDDHDHRQASLMAYSCQSVAILANREMADPEIVATAYRLG